MKQKNSNKKNEEKFIKKEVIKYGSYSLKQEKDREDNIYRSAESLITCISILLVALTTLIFELLDRLKQIELLIVIFGCILFFILMLSMIFAIITRWFYKKVYMRTCKDLLQYIENNKILYIKENGFLEQKINDIDDECESLIQINNKRTNNILISYFLLLIFIFLFFSFSIAIMIVL